MKNDSIYGACALRGLRDLLFNVYLERLFRRSENANRIIWGHRVQRGIRLLGGRTRLLTISIRINFLTYGLLALRRGLSTYELLGGIRTTRRNKFAQA